MARKKKQESSGSGGSAEWMTTFSDLMNLLLCFFVLLFSMSTVDAEKFEELAASLKASYSIFDGGAASLSEGNLISSGISQLNELDDYYNNMGTNPDESDTQIEDMEQYEEMRNEEMAEESEAIGEQLQDDLEMNGILSEGTVDVEITAQYVMLNLNGAVLFDSSSADIKAGAQEFLDKLGNVLKKYGDYQIEIVGHTDSRPMGAGAKYANNMLLSQARAYTIFDYLVNEKGMEPSTMKSSGRGEYEPVATNTTAEGRAQNRRVEVRIYNSYTATSSK